MFCALVYAAQKYRYMITIRIDKCKYLKKKSCGPDHFFMTKCPYAKPFLTKYYLDKIRLMQDTEITSKPK